METATAPPRVGGKLPNGRTLVAIRLISERRRDWAGDLYAVLALTGADDDRYVVWNYVHPAADGEPLPQGPYCYQGFYTADFEKAVEDWRTRGRPYP